MTRQIDSMQFNPFRTDQSTLSNTAGIVTPCQRKHIGAFHQDGLLRTERPRRLVSFFFFFGFPRWRALFNLSCVLANSVEPDELTSSTLGVLFQLMLAVFCEPPQAVRLKTILSSSSRLQCVCPTSFGRR